MSNPTTSRKRMLRVRKVQHDIAVGAFVRSRSELAKVENSQERVKNLQSAIQISVGSTNGAGLARQAEMSGRLQQASAHLDMLRRQASEAQLVRDLQRVAAEQALQGVKKLVSREEAMLEAIAVKRGTVRPRRRPTTLLGEDRS